jgi:hypothetical protein
MRIKSLSLAAVTLLAVACGGGDGVSPSAGPSTTNLAVGQSAVFVDSAHFATQLALQSGAEYLIAVVNTDTSSSAREDFTLHGTAGTSAMAAHAVAAATPRASTGVSPMRGLLKTLRVAESNHLKMLERNRAVYARNGSPLPGLAAQAAALRASGPSARTETAGVTATVGVVNHLSIAASFGASCNDVDSVGARTVAVGEHIVVVVDTASNWPRPDSSYWGQFANEYDNVTYPHILANIGNPLLLDSRLSNAGRITVLFTPLLNRNFTGGIVAFVNSCDFYARSQYAGSNQTEIFYGWVPESPDTGWTPNLWGRFMRSVAAHETKHIVSFGEHISQDANFEQVWLEEGLAQESAEIWARHFNTATWKGHDGWSATLGCELDESDACYAATNPLTLFDHLSFLYIYDSTASVAPSSEGVNVTTEGRYGAGWALARWATDQFGSSEPSFIESLIDDPTYNGMANVSQHTGQPAATLLVYWSLASAIFDSVTWSPSDARTTNPSFNYANIFTVGSEAAFDFNGWPLPTHPTPLSSGAFDEQVLSIPGAGASYFLLNAPSAGSEALELRSGSGSAIASSSGFRVGILRVQ